MQIGHSHWSGLSSCRGTSASGAEYLLEDEALDREPGIELAKRDLLLDAQEIVEPAVELRRRVVGGLAKGLLDDERMVRHPGLQVRHATAPITDGAGLQQPAPVAHQRVEQPGRLAAGIQERLQDARDLALTAARERIREREDFFFATVAHQGAHGR